MSRIGQPSDRRERRRAKVLLEAWVERGGVAEPCHVRDLGLSGAAIGGVRGLEPGDVFMLAIPRYGRFPAATIWARGERAGLAFVEGARAGMQRIIAHTPGLDRFLCG